MKDELPQGWATASLATLAEARMGETILAKQLTPTGIPVYSAGGENEPWGFFENPRKLLAKGAVVVSARGSIGFPKIPKVERFASTQTTITLQFPDQELAAYTCLWLKTVNWSSLTKGGAIPMLTVGDINELVVPLAPLGEERRIVAKLEKLLDKVDTCQERLAKIPVLLKRFRQSVLAAACSSRLTADWRAENPQREIERNTAPDDAPDVALTWGWKRLSEISQLRGGVTKGRKFNGKKTVQLPYLRVANVQDGYLDLREIKLIEALPEDKEKYALKVDDLLFTEGGDRDKLGRGTVWRGEIADCIHQNHIFRARLLTSEVVPDFISLATKSDFSRRYFFENASQTVNLASINVTMLGALPIPLPPLAEQQEIVRRVEALFALADQIEARYAKAKAHVEKLGQSILAKAFRGELVPQDPNDEPASVLLAQIRAGRVAFKRH